MTKQQLEYFLSAVEFSSLSKAAAFHYSSIPAFTRQINALEDELGTKLFVRSRRGLKLNTAGALFHPVACDTLSLLYSYRSEVTANGLLSSPPKDEFVMGYYPFGGMYSAYAALIDRYLNLWLGKRCALRCIKGGSMADAVRDGLVDVGAVSSSQLDKYGDTFESRTFFKSQCTLLVSSDHELSCRSQISVKEIVENYSSFELYLPDSVVSSKLRNRKIHGSKDIIDLCRLFLEFLPLWTADFSVESERGSARMMFMASDIKRPELVNMHSLIVEGSGVNMDVKLFWKKDNPSPSIERFKAALDFADIK